ncbi:MAG: hypothetical protein WCI04_02745 [archaeon]
MISKLYAEFLEEFKRLGGALSLHQEIALKQLLQEHPEILKEEKKWPKQQILSAFS